MAGAKTSEEEADIKRSIRFHEGMMYFNLTRLKELLKKKSTQLELELGPPK